MIDTRELGPRSAALGVLAAVLALAAVHILEAAFRSEPESTRPDVTMPDGSPAPAEDCVLMPDGVRVCDQAGKTGDQPKTKTREQ